MSILPITVVSKHVGHPSSSSDMPSLLSCFRLPLLLARSPCPRMSRSCLHLSGPANLPQVLSSQRCLPSPHHSSPSPRHHYQAHIAISHHLSPLSSVLLFSIVLISIHVLFVHYLFILLYLAWLIYAFQYKFLENTGIVFHEYCFISMSKNTYTRCSINIHWANEYLMFLKYKAQLLELGQWEMRENSKTHCLLRAKISLEGQAQYIQHK